MEDSLKVALGIIGVLAAALVWLVKRRGRNGQGPEKHFTKSQLEWIDTRAEHKANNSVAPLTLKFDAMKETSKDHENRIRALEAMSFDHTPRRR